MNEPMNDLPAIKKFADTSIWEFKHTPELALSEIEMNAQISAWWAGTEKSADSRKEYQLISSFQSFD